jgi:hypothetical protein
VVSRTLALGLAALALAFAADAPGADADARVEIALDRQDAFVHEQVVLSLRIVHPLEARPSWETPAFEGFWAERMSSVAEPMASGASERVRTTIFRRALFPTRSGTLEIPRSKLRLELDGGREQWLQVPAARLRVLPLPAASRPADFSEVVGSVRVDVDLSASQVAQDASVRLVLDYYGDANLWDAPAPRLEELFGDAVEVFPEAPYSTSGERDGRLTTRRTLRFDLVPHERGRFVLPAFELAYFDPAERGYRRAASERLEFEVLGRGDVSRARPGASAAQPAPPPLPWPLLALASALAALSAAGVLRSFWRRARLRALGPRPPSPRALFEDAAAAVGSERFAEQLALAIKAGIHARHQFDPRALTSDEIAARIDDPEAIGLLRSLERMRFAPGHHQPETLLAAVRRYLAL